MGNEGAPVRPTTRGFSPEEKAIGHATPGIAMRYSNPPTSATRPSLGHSGIGPDIPSD